MYPGGSLTLVLLTMTMQVSWWLLWKQNDFLFPSWVVLSYCLFTLGNKTTVTQRALPSMLEPGSGSLHTEVWRKQSPRPSGEGPGLAAAWQCPEWRCWRAGDQERLCLGPERWSRELGPPPENPFPAHLVYLDMSHDLSRVSCLPLCLSPCSLPLRAPGFPVSCIPFRGYVFQSHDAHPVSHFCALMGA